MRREFSEMKKMLSRATLLLIVIFVWMTAFAGLAAAESACVEAEGRVNVRRGVGLDAPIMGTIEKGSQLPYAGDCVVDDRGVVWYEVCYNDNDYGWVSSRYSRLLNYELGVSATDGQTNIRSRGSLSGRILGVLPMDATATFLNETNVDDRGVVWYYVRYDGLEGWVSSRYTLLGSPRGYTRKVIAEDGQTYIRSMGALAGDIEGVLPKGATATYLDARATDGRGVVWYYVRYQGVVGWVSSLYTTLK